MAWKRKPVKALRICATARVRDNQEQLRFCWVEETYVGVLEVSCMVAALLQALYEVM